MRTEADGTRWFTSDDVNIERVHTAMTAVGRRITEQRIADMRARGIRPCCSTDGRTGLTCNAESVGVYLKGPRCARHTPAAENGRPETVPGCNHPLRCYCPKHRNVAPVDNSEARAELEQHELEWVNAFKREILTLASLPTPFTLAHLAEFMPSRRDSTKRQLIELRIAELLIEAVDRGLLVKHPERNEWKGIGRGTPERA